MSKIKPSIWLSSILPFNRLEYKLVFVLILALLAPLSMVTLQWQADRVPESLVPAPATVFWTTTGCLVLATLLIYLLVYPVFVLSRAVEHYHLNNADPGLPAYFTDPTGRLLGNIQLLIRTALRQERLLKEASMEEYLGEVPNRTWCERRLNSEMERSRSSREPLSIGILVLGNLDYLKANQGPGIAQYCLDHLLNSIHANTPVEHWVARWDEGQVLFVAWARPEEAEIICNRIQSGIRSMVLRTPMGKTINLDLRQCLYHFRPEQEPGEVLGKLEAAVARLCVQHQGAYPSLLLVA
jgi:GGDEF domain-containing protein